jgi:hypothetical protein
MKQTDAVADIRKQFVETSKQLEVLWANQRRLCGEVIKLLKDEPDINKRKEIIDVVFADKVEEVMEYFFRREYLKET